MFTEPTQKSRTFTEPTQKSRTSTEPVQKSKESLESVQQPKESRPRGRAAAKLPAQDESGLQDEREQGKGRSRSSATKELKPRSRIPTEPSSRAEEHQPAHEESKLQEEREQGKGRLRSRATKELKPRSRKSTNRGSESMVAPEEPRLQHEMKQDLEGLSKTRTSSKPLSPNKRALKTRKAAHYTSLKDHSAPLRSCSPVITLETASANLDNNSRVLNPAEDMIPENAPGTNLDKCASSLGNSSANEKHALKSKKRPKSSVIRRWSEDEPNRNKATKDKVRRKDMASTNRTVTLPTDNTCLENISSAKETGDDDTQGQSNLPDSISCTKCNFTYNNLAGYYHHKEKIPII